MKKISLNPETRKEIYNDIKQWFVRGVNHFYRSYDDYDAEVNGIVIVVEDWVGGRLEEVESEGWVEVTLTGDDGECYDPELDEMLTDYLLS